MEAPAQFIQAIMDLPWWWIAGLAIVVAISCVGLLWRCMSVESFEPYLSVYKKEIEECDFEGKKGLMIIVGMKDVPGASTDARNMEKVASELKFAVVKIPNASRCQLRAIVKAAGEFSFVSEAPSCKVILFYYAGHGGSDRNKRPFVVTSDSEVNVEEIVSPLEPINANRLKDLRRLFFFDMCLGPRVDYGIRALRRPKPTTQVPVLKYAVPAKGNCLVAFSGTIGYAVRGADDKGGYWTRYLFQNLTENMDIHVVLAKTWKETVEFTSTLTIKDKNPQVQGPSFFSCMGPLNLKLGINEQEEERFERPRHESRSMPGPSMLRARGQAKPDSDANSSSVSHVSGHSGRVATDDGSSNIGNLMKKQPELRDLSNWLKPIESDWAKLGRQLGVEKSDMDSLTRNASLTNGGRLCEVLDIWKRSLCSPCTFKHLLESLEEIKEGECAKTIRKKFQKTEVQERYRSKPDNED